MYSQFLPLLKKRNFLCRWVDFRLWRLDTPSPNRVHRNYFAWETWQRFSRILSFCLRRLPIWRTWRSLRSTLLWRVAFWDFYCKSWDRWISRIRLSKTVNIDINIVYQSVKCKSTEHNLVRCLDTCRKDVSRFLCRDRRKRKSNACTSTDWCFAGKISRFRACKCSSSCSSILLFFDRTNLVFQCYLKFISKHRYGNDFPYKYLGIFFFFCPCDRTNTNGHSRESQRVGKYGKYVQTNETIKSDVTRMSRSNGGRGGGGDPRHVESDTEFTIWIINNSLNRF